jgi:cytochrome b
MTGADNPQAEQREDAPRDASAVPAGVQPGSGVPVWDLPVRLFHWLLVALIVALWVTATRGWMSAHYVCGMATLALLLFRIGWGVVGSSTARFVQFVRGPRAGVAYLRELALGGHPLHAGHNPAGGWMVLAFLLLILVQAVLGLFANNEFDFEGPLAGLVSGKLSDRLTRVHVFLFDAILACIWLHLCAIFFYRLVRRDDLVRPMLSGTKSDAQVPPGTALKFASPLRALLLLVAAAVAVALIAPEIRRLFA